MHIDGRFNIATDAVHRLEWRPGMRVGLEECSHNRFDRNARNACDKRGCRHPARPIAINDFRIDASSLNARFLPPHPDPLPKGEGEPIPDWDLQRRSGSSNTGQNGSLSLGERVGVRGKETRRIRKTETFFGNHPSLKEPR